MNLKKMKADYHKDWLTNLEKNEKGQDRIWFNYLYSECKKVINEFLTKRTTPDLNNYFKLPELSFLYVGMYKTIGLDMAKWYVKHFEKYIEKQNDLQFDLWEQQYAFIGEKIAGERIVSVSGSRKKEFNNILRKQMSNPEFMSMHEAAAGRILRKKFKGMSAFNARRIVRTESVNIANYATNQSAAEIFGADNLKKEWIATIDARTRDSHLAANGQIAFLNGMFEVDGEKLSHPGDSRGSAKNVINCRCTSAPLPII